MGDHGYYSASEVARIAGVPRSTLDYWSRTKLIVASQRAFPPRLYSFADLRDVCVASKLREQKAKIHHIRRALDYVRKEHDVARLAHANFVVTDGGLTFLPPGEAEPVAPHLQGQRKYFVNMPEILKELGAGDATVQQLRPSSRVLIDPAVRGGTPVIEGTRIPTQLISELVDEGLSYGDIVDLYPSLSRDDVDAAVDWERKRTKKADAVAG